MSDTASIGSSQSGGDGTPRPPAVSVEESGSLPLPAPDFIPRRMVVLGQTMAALSADGRLVLGELRCRGGAGGSDGEEWSLSGKSVAVLPGSAAGDKRYLDLALVRSGAGGEQNALALIFLVEKKNKERLLSAHHVRQSAKGTLSLDQDESASYDKANVLGKGVSHLAADPSAAEPTVYAVSNLVRKLRLEEGGSALRPTPARAQVPAEAQDGTLSMAVQSGGGGGGKQSPTHVVVSFRTKSATKNKFMVEWFHSGRKDEVTCTKSAVKMVEDSEPACVLSDPRDARSAYALCVSRSSSSTSLHRLTRGRRHEDPLAVLPFEAEVAAAAVSPADRQCVVVLAYDPGRAAVRVYTMQKTEGFRGRHPCCSSGRCPALEALSSPAHAVSCATTRWQISSAAADLCIGSRASFQVCLVTLLDKGSSSSVATEPESGHPYRVRAVSCPVQSASAVAVVLDDLERQFEGSEERLSSCALRLCLSGPPCRDSVSKLSAWLMSGRMATAEVSFVRGQDQEAVGGGSERLVLRPITADKFRGYVTEVDWTQQAGVGGGNQRQSTFTLDSGDGGGGGGAPGSAQGPRSRIPRMSSSLSAAEHLEHLAATAASAASPQPCSPRPSTAPAPASFNASEALLGLVSELGESLKAARREEESLGTRLRAAEAKLQELSLAMASSASTKVNGTGTNAHREEEEEEEVLE